MRMIILALSLLVGAPSFAITPPQATLMRSIDSAPFSERLKSLLKDEVKSHYDCDLQTLIETTVFTRAELRKVWGFGAKSADELETFLESHGERLGASELENFTPATRIAALRLGVRTIPEMRGRMVNLRSLPLNQFEREWLKRIARVLESAYPADTTSLDSATMPGPQSRPLAAPKATTLTEEGLDQIARGLFRLTEALASSEGDDLIEDTAYNREQIRRIREQLGLVDRCVKLLEEGH